jgi:hypothetical protein
MCGTAYWGLIVSEDVREGQLVEIAGYMPQDTRLPGSVHVRFADEFTGSIRGSAYISESWWSRTFEGSGVTFQDVKDSGVPVLGMTFGIYMGLLPKPVAPQVPTGRALPIQSRS